MRKIVLGLNFGHDGSACVLVDGKLAAAISTERLSRTKNGRGVTPAVINYVLGKAGVTYKDVEVVAVANWFWDTDLQGKELCDKTGFRITHPQSGLDYTQNQTEGINRGNNLAEGYWAFQYSNMIKKCVVMNHHSAHCAYVFFMSPFDKAVAMSVDYVGGGDNHVVMLFDYPNRVVTRIRRGGDFPIGAFYGQVTDFLGFWPSLSGAGKVMGLAAFGKPFEITSDYLDPSNLVRGDLYQEILLRAGVTKIPDMRIYYPQLPGEGGKADPSWLKKSDWDKPLNQNIAATIQYALEKWCLSMVHKIREMTHNVTDNLCLAGGTMLNCVNNGKVLHNGGFKNVFLAPACGDEGLAIGAAAYAHYCFEPEWPATKYKHTYREAFEGGRLYSQEEITGAMSEVGISMKNEVTRDGKKVFEMEIPDNWRQRYKGLEGIAALHISSPSEDEQLEELTKDLIQYKICCWLYRGSEIGPRALGNRSIISNPTNPDMKDLLNLKVKHREQFRPFAPAVLKEHASKWFHIPEHHESPFMLFSVDCLKPKEIPSAVHVDGTARLQTVDEENNGKYYRLIKKFYEKTNVPVLLNTSFNIQGEPIVESPLHAINCFLGTRLDTLAIENYLIRKVEKKG